MNYHVVRLLSRIASETASTVVWVFFDKYRKNSFSHTRRSGYGKRGNKQYNKNSYYASDSNTKRPYVPKNKPHQSLLDQARSQQEVSARTNKLNGKKNA